MVRDVLCPGTYELLPVAYPPKVLPEVARSPRSIEDTDCPPVWLEIEELLLSRRPELRTSGTALPSDTSEFERGLARSVIVLRDVARGSE